MYLCEVRLGKHTYVYWYHLINNNISQNNNSNSEQQQHQPLTRGYTSPLEGVPDLVTPWGSLLCEGLRFWCVFFLKEFVLCERLDDQAREGDCIALSSFFRFFSRVDRRLKEGELPGDP